MRKPQYVAGPGPGEYTTQFAVEGKHIVEFISHAEQRMKQRGILMDEVMATLRSPTRTGIPGSFGRTRVRRNRGRTKAVDVVYEVRTDRILVVTVILVEFQ